MFEGLEVLESLGCLEGLGGFWGVWMELELGMFEVCGVRGVGGLGVWVVGSSSS